ncbi:MAG: 6-phosphofructokinase [Chloroflexi bacterium]|nr:6-phosphofructokinase [Chloroflexota bacterium]MBI3733955.1 6-phosphofructokinase [Chloroflexota bacterium]
MPVKRIGISTGGGDCAGLNAVIRAVVLTALNQFQWEVIGIEDGYDGLLNDHCRRLDYKDVRGILSLGGTILGTTNRGNPFRYPTKVNDHVVMVDRSDELIQKIHSLGLDALVVIGGDGSLRIALELIAKGVKLVGVPKTIDNDIEGTDMTFGFDTALSIATDAIDRLHTTAESHHRVMIVEVMGRTAGWIALHAGLAGSAHAILIPEIPFRYEPICDMILARTKYGRRFSIIVVAEGAMPLGGEAVYRDKIANRLGGIGQVVADEIANRTGKETRVTVLGHIQRGGSPTAFDRLLATRFGAAAVHLIAREQFGQMVALQGSRLTHLPIAKAVERLKLVPVDGELAQTARDTGVVFGDEAVFDETMLDATSQARRAHDLRDSGAFDTNRQNP